ncbi:MAG: glycosyltransferase family 2 protein [Gammaproteobacteria bacterium]|nr:glycosyltransferase family 2 protein [Gammaproteobacteria bacterium]
MQQKTAPGSSVTSYTRDQVKPLEELGSGVRAHVELAFSPGPQRGRIIIGWLYDPGANKTRLAALGAKGRGESVAIPLRDGEDGVRIVTTARPDVSAAMGAAETSTHQHGFVILLPGRLEQYSLAVLLDEQAGTLGFTLETRPAELANGLRACWPHAGASVRGMCLGADAALLALIDQFQLAQFDELYPSMTRFLRDPRRAFAAMDQAFCLGDAGLVIFGWHFEPAATLASISVHGPAGLSCDVSDALYALQRRDVLEQLHQRYPDVGEMRGFFGFVPLATFPGDARALCLRFADEQEVWLKLPTDEPHRSGLALVREILESIPSPEKLRHQLHTIYERGLGAAIEATARADRGTPPVPVCQQFGTPPANPTVSVIVPLYGRYDFLRHQLVHFADDPDFVAVDLIYVVDDPAITLAALDTAVAYHELLGTAFRLVHYGRNLGFAGANNVGVSLARADTVLLLNSDVIPRARGWLGALQRALDELPGAGAVGPLLQYCDDSIQHAGMCPQRDPFVPGFLLNVHPGKGQMWNGGEEPAQQELLTAACLMLRKADYLDCGGLDEGYLVGDFEDSDLCLALRQRARTLWLVPRARLWHLERQSQNANASAGFRQLLTLFNGWRYQGRIRAGIIANPETDGPDDAHRDL